MTEQEKKPDTVPIVMPLVTPEEAKKAWDEYTALKQAIQTEDDVMIIGDHNFLKKSYWRKIATYFNLSVEVIEEKTQTIAGELVYHFRARAKAPNGRYAEGAGSCSQKEKSQVKTIHNTRATAETRAFNRAISNLVGGGEVSAEEAESDGNFNNGQKSKDISGSLYKPKMATDPQKRLIYALAKNKGIDSENIKDQIKNMFKLSSFNDLSISQATKAIEQLKGQEATVTQINDKNIVETPQNDKQGANNEWDDVDKYIK